MLLVLSCVMWLSQMPFLHVAMACLWPFLMPASGYGIHGVAFQVPLLGYDMYAGASVLYLDNGVHEVVASHVFARL